MFEKVCEILADKFDADASTMTMDTKVKEDLNADSLDVVELMMDLEENFGVTCCLSKRNQCDPYDQ